MRIPDFAREWFFGRTLPWSSARSPERSSTLSTGFPSGIGVVSGSGIRLCGQLYSVFAGAIWIGRGRAEPSADGAAVEHPDEYGGGESAGAAAGARVLWEDGGLAERGRSADEQRAEYHQHGEPGDAAGDELRAGSI